MWNGLTLFLRRKYPYLLGFALIEAVLFHFDGLNFDVGDLTADLAPGLVNHHFRVWQCVTLALRAGR